MTTPNIEERKLNSPLDNSHQNLQKSNKNFELCYQNVRSLKNRLEEIEILIKEYNSDLVILIETWTSKKPAVIKLKNNDNKNTLRLIKISETYSLQYTKFLITQKNLISLSPYLVTNKVHMFI